MSAERSRQRKLADRIQVIVAQTLERGVKDPRLGFVTITEVRVTGDLQHASIFYTVLGDDEDRARTAEGLASASGVIRREIGRGITLRLTPTIEFLPDAIPENAGRIEELLRTAHELDEQVRTTRSGASYAGEADPYREAKPTAAAEEHSAAGADDNSPEADDNSAAADEDQH